MLLVEKWQKLSYKIDESAKLAAGGCILVTVVLLIIDRMCFFRFVDDIFDVVFLAF